MPNRLRFPRQKWIVEHEPHIVFDHPQPFRGSVQRGIKNPNNRGLRHVYPLRLLSGVVHAFRLDHTPQPILRTERAKAPLAISSTGQTSCLERATIRGYTFRDFCGWRKGWV